MITVPTPTTPVMPTTTPDSREQRPENFTGKTQDVEAWVEKMDRFFRLQPNSYPTDSRRIDSALNSLSGAAYAWGRTWTPMPLVGTQGGLQELVVAWSVEGKAGFK